MKVTVPNDYCQQARKREGMWGCLVHRIISNVSKKFGPLIGRKNKSHISSNIPAILYPIDLFSTHVNMM